MNLTNTQIHRLSEILKATEADIKSQTGLNTRVLVDFIQEIPTVDEKLHTRNELNDRIKMIQASVSDGLGINVAYFFEKIKTHEVCFAKHCLFYYIKKYTSMNYSEIGKRYGKSHSTIILGIRSYTNLITLYDEYAAKNAAVEEAIRVYNTVLKTI